MIDKKEKHRIENYDEILEIIEIQTGSYFGEMTLQDLKIFMEEKIFTEKPFPIPASNEDIKLLLGEIPKAWSLQIFR